MDWVRAVEHAYVAAATGATTSRAVPDDPELALRARAAMGAVASRYLAVGTPRSFGVIVGPEDEAAAWSLAAHRTWFDPVDVRCAGSARAAKTIGATWVDLADALTCDIVCVHRSLTIAAGDVRRGSHLNLLASCELDSELMRLGQSKIMIVPERPGLVELAAGIIDGRQLDEITVFLAGDARIALAALDALA